MLAMSGCATVHQSVGPSDKELDLAYALMTRVINDCCLEFDELYGVDKLPSCTIDATLVMKTISVNDHEPSEVCALWE